MIIQKHKMARIIISIGLSFFMWIFVYGNDSNSADTISLLFIGDIMGHDQQIASAYNSTSNEYNFTPVFNKVSQIIHNADFAIANLEVTLAGIPYQGYPLFSSPDELAVACKNSGINVLVTANNHSCDRGKNGIINTLNKLDSLKIKHTGTYRDVYDRDSNNLLILKKGEIKVGLLNYTFSTNGLPFPAPTIVNLLDSVKIVHDINKSKKEGVDKLIVFLHWGNEYQSHISENQKQIAAFLFTNGVDIIIGSHPHVIQKMEYFPKNKNSNEQFIAYSLGNFISNQRVRKSDGGAMVKLTLEKKEGETIISNLGYYLTWVYKYVSDGKYKYEILPCYQYEQNDFKNMDNESISKMKLFITDSRELLQKNNISVNEITN